MGEHVPETISNCLISQKPRPPPPQNSPVQSWVQDATFFESFVPLLTSTQTLPHRRAGGGGALETKKCRTAPHPHVFSVTAGNSKGSARKHDPEPCMTCDLHVPGTTPPPTPPPTQPTHTIFLGKFSTVTTVTMFDFMIFTDIFCSNIKQKGICISGRGNLQTRLLLFMT